MCFGVENQSSSPSFLGIVELHWYLWMPQNMLPNNEFLKPDFLSPPSFFSTKFLSNLYLQACLGNTYLMDIIHLGLFSSWKLEDSTAEMFNLVSSVDLFWI